MVRKVDGGYSGRRPTGLLGILEAVAEGVQEESLLPDCLGAKCDVSHGSAHGEGWVVDRAADLTRLVAFALRDPVR